ncbi:MAG: helix-turn-helix domain-containing protein [Bacilli bacterium]
MNVGEIIRNERLRLGLTQAQLCDQICSVSHLSKLENGIQGISYEIIELLLRKLGVSLDAYEEKQQLLEQQLDQLYMNIYHLDYPSAKETMDELETMQSEYQYSNVYDMFLLIQFRYYTFLEDKKKATELLKQLQELAHTFSTSDKDVFYHFCGAYYLLLGNAQCAMEYLQKVSKHYQDKDYMQHLAVGYYLKGARLLAYEKALLASEKYKQENNYRKLFDIEMFIGILLIDENDECGTQKAVEKFTELLQSPYFTNDNDTKGRIYHNLGYAAYITNEKQKALSFMEEALMLRKKDSLAYLKTLAGYIEVALSQEMIAPKMIAEKIKEGLALAKKLANERYTILLTSYLKKNNSKYKEYIDYVEGYVIPYIQENNLHFKLETYCKELFAYYKHNNQSDKAVEIASYVIDLK